MSVTIKPTITFDKLGASLESLADTFSPKSLKDDFMMEASDMILKDVDVRFDKAEDPEGKKWLSNAAQTKLGGRFSVAYNTRPSGATVTGSSSRLTDTGAFRRSFRTILMRWDKLIVGPTGSRNGIIAQAAAAWGNIVAGFGPKLRNDLNKLMENYLYRKAMK